MRRRHKAWMFDCVRTEGALLPPDLLAKVAALDARLPGVRPVDYHLDEGERIADRIAASWSALLGRWAAFKEARLKLDATAGETETGTRLTRERWLLPLFQELGYGRLVTESTGVSVGDRTYDISHLWHHSPIHLLGYRVDL